MKDAICRLQWAGGWSQILGVIESVPPVPDSLHLQFARGWLALGDVGEAELELGRIRPEYLGCADVLELRFQVLSRRGRHEDALVVADQQVADFPEEFRGHMNRGNALFWLDRAEEACEAVESVLPEHPKVAAFPYNLACYCMKLGRVDDAIRWLELSMKVGQKEGVIQHALVDPDLKGLWEYLRKLG
jgi:tetratricopeptide (TPR) repeat protein